MKESKENKSFKILVIEDDEPMRESVVFKLRKTGFTVDDVGNGYTGMEKLHADPSYGGVLLDIRLPQKDGFWFLEEKNKYPQLREIPVLVFSNVGEGQVMKRALHLGAKGFLVKAAHSIDDIIGKVKMCFLEGICDTDYS